MRTYTVTCRRTTGDFPRWYLESDGREPQVLGRVAQFDSDLLVLRLAAGYIAQQLGFTVTGSDRLIKEGLAPGGSWTAAGYTGAYPVYRVTVTVAPTPEPTPPRGPRHPTGA